MDRFIRGLQAYLLGLAFVSALGIVWATDAYVLNPAAPETGWPLMVALAGVLVLLGLVIRGRWGPKNRESTVGDVPW